MRLRDIVIIVGLASIIGGLFIAGLLYGLIIGGVLVSAAGLVLMDAKS